jgi:hypothetical protein
MNTEELWQHILTEAPQKPYDWNSLSNWDMDNFKKRENFTRCMSWAIPSKEAIQKIASFTNSILEVGAGLGLWAYLLKDAGVNFTATDNYSSRGSFIMGDTPNFTEVINITHMGAIRAYGDKHEALMLCWPPYSDPMAAEALKAFPGSKVVYIGEYPGDGCTADSEFGQLITKEFEVVEEFPIPQWMGLHDYLSLHKKKEQPLRRAFDFEE